MIRCAIAISVLAMTATVTADQARGITVATDNVVAAQGGVLMLPLTARRHGDQWPATFDVKLSDGRQVEGRVALVTAVPTANDRSWTADPNIARVRQIISTDDTSRDGAPYLLAELPADFKGSVEVRRRKIRVTWVTLVSPPIAAPPLPIESRPDRPDPRSPFEFWRWVVLADQLGWARPSTSHFDPLAALAADRHAQLWRAALARLDAIDPVLSARCRKLLTRRCGHRDGEIAAWVTDPNQTSALLTLLLDDRRQAADLQLVVDAWCEGIDPLLTWLASAESDHVVLVMLNRSDEPIVTRFSWSETDELPIAVELPPGRVSRVLVDRPLVGPDGVALLEIDSASGRRYSLPVHPPFETAQPPAAFNVELRPSLTLARLERGELLPAVPERATRAQVRRRAGRWEIFIECRRPEATEAAAETRAAAEGWPIGRDAIVLLLGPEGARDGPGVELIVPEHGRVEMRRGRDDGSLGVHRKSYGDRWYCRIEIPDPWLPVEEGEPLRIGCVRTFADIRGFQTAPGTTASWRPLAGRRAILLSGWDL